MGIVILYCLFVYYFLPVVALLCWIVRYTIIVRENEENRRTVSFTGALKDTMKQCYGFYIVSITYIIALFVGNIFRRRSLLETLFLPRHDISLWQPGYFAIVCLIVGLVYSYVFYKRHSK